MLDGKALRAAVEKHKPDVIVPEIEAIDTATLAELEKEGWRVAPSAKAVQLTMNRDGIRDFAARELGLVTSKYRFAESREEAVAAAERRRLPVRGQAGDVELGQGPEHREECRGAGKSLGLCGRQHARRPAARDRRGVHRLRQRDHACSPSPPRTACCSAPPVGHRQEAGDYRESWQPAASLREALSPRGTRRARWSRRSAGTASSGSSSSSAATRRSSPSFRPRPHDTGMVTMISQFPNQFELHLRAVLGLPIPSIELIGPSASAAILADRGEREVLLSRGLPKRSPSARRASPSIFASSPSPRRSRIGEWALRSRAAKMSKKRSNAPRLQPRASRFVIG